MEREEVLRNLIIFNVSGTWSRAQDIHDIEQLREIYALSKEALNAAGFKGKWVLEHKLEEEDNNVTVC